MTTILYCTAFIVGLFSWALMPRPTQAERAAEDAEFGAQYCQRRGDEVGP